MAREINIKEIQRENTFYMVYVEGYSTPAKTYEREDEASNEAYRLTVKEHKNAYVLKAIKGYEYCYGIGAIDVEE